ncbi:MAG: transposase [Nitrospira sp.]|nr:transposase [Nitrospira sp.]
MSVHQPGVHRARERPEDSDQHGRQGLLAGYRARGATLEEPEILGSLFGAYDTVSAALQRLERYRVFYNQTRPHQALDGQTPDQVHYDHLTTRQTAVSSAICQAPLMNWQKLPNQPEPPLRWGDVPSLRRLKWHSLEGAGCHM